MTMRYQCYLMIMCSFDPRRCDELSRTGDSPFLDCSQSPIFSWDRLDIRVLPSLVSWFLNVPRGPASGIIALGGSGGGGVRGEKNIFLASSQTAAAP